MGGGNGAGLVLRTARPFLESDATMGVTILETDAVLLPPKALKFHSVFMELNALPALFGMLDIYFTDIFIGRKIRLIIIDKNDIFVYYYRLSTHGPHAVEGKCNLHQNAMATEEHRGMRCG